MNLTLRLSRVGLLPPLWRKCEASMGWPLWPHVHERL